MCEHGIYKPFMIGIWKIKHVKEYSNNYNSYFSMPVVLLCTCCYIYHHQLAFCTWKPFFFSFLWNELFFKKWIYIFPQLSLCIQLAIHTNSKVTGMFQIAVLRLLFIRFAFLSLLLYEHFKCKLLLKYNITLNTNT